MQTIYRLFFLALSFNLASCSTLETMQFGALETVKYVALEKISGVQKHDILVDRIEDTAKAQEETKQQLQVAYQALSNIAESDVSQMEAQLEQIEDTYEDSEAVAETLKKHIDAVDRVAKALFTEWRSELREYTNQNLRRKSADNLAATKAQYATLKQSMKKSYKGIEPLLSVLRDNSLYLKHNRSANAISGFQSEVKEVEVSMQTLIDEMDASIAESQAFVGIVQVQ